MRNNMGKQLKKISESAPGTEHVQLLRKCPLCPKTFSTNFRLRVHISSHTQEKPFKCEHCDFRTARESTAQTHVERSHKNTKLQQCPLCIKSFSTILELRTHIRSHTKEKPFKCEHCDFSTACKQRHQKHVQRTHDKAVWETRLKFKCDACPYKGHTPASLRLHKWTHLEDSARVDFLCEYPGCDFKAKTSYSVENHYKRLHSDENPLACKVEGCTYRCKLVGDIKQHMIKHRADRPFHCSETNCDYKAKTQSALQVHLTMKHGDVFHHCSHKDCAYKTKSMSSLKSHVIGRYDAAGGFQCTHKNCNFRSVTKGGLKNHLANHMRKQANICGFPNCSYQTPEKHRLVRHLKAHSQVRPFPCTVPGCKFRAKTEDVLRAHKYTHNKAALLPCAVPGCPYLGRNKRSLSAHVRLHIIHPNLRACPQPCCSYFAKDWKSFQRHQQLHDKRRPFTCPFCPKFFESQTSLDVHSFCHTNERPLRCVCCNYGTYLRTTLKRHYERHHPGEKFNSDGLENDAMTCKYCHLSGTTETSLKHEVCYHKQPFVKLEKIQVKFV